MQAFIQDGDALVTLSGEYGDVLRQAVAIFDANENAELKFVAMSAEEQLDAFDKAITYYDGD